MAQDGEQLAWSAIKVVVLAAIGGALIAMGLAFLLGLLF